MSDTTVSWDEVRERLLQDPEVKREYDRLAPKYQAIRLKIAKRVRKGLKDSPEVIPIQGRASQEE